MKDGTRRAGVRAAHAVALGAVAAACTSTTSTTPAPTGTTSEADCMTLADGAFPDGDPYPYPKAKASPHPAVRACCQHSLDVFYARRTYDPVMGRHRRACCASVDTSPPHIAAACAP